MLILKAFDSEDRFLLEGDLTISAKELTFEYALTDRTGLFEVPSGSRHWPCAEVPRRLQLWESTCFEAFLQPHHEGRRLEKYYEFNFSLAPAWNVFRFEGYRQPLPLEPSEDFIFESLEWVAPQKRLIARVTNKSPYQKFSMALTAVLQEKTQARHFCSTLHHGPKPDFHLADSFTLIRGV